MFSAIIKLLRCDSVTSHKASLVFCRYVLDCKLGVRTFVEKEARNESLREDLYKKAKALAPWMLTDEENERGTITKYRQANLCLDLYFSMLFDFVLAPSLLVAYQKPSFQQLTGG